MRVHNRREPASYLLVDEIFVIILDTQFPLHILDFRALLENFPLGRNQVFPHQFTLSNHSEQLSGIFQFLSETPEFFGTLEITATSLAHLSNLAPTEAYIRVPIVRALASFGLWILSAPHLP